MCLKNLGAGIVGIQSLRIFFCANVHFEVKLREVVGEWGDNSFNFSPVFKTNAPSSTYIIQNRSKRVPYEKVTGRWITGSGDGGFGEDGCCWAGTEMGQSDWKTFFKDNL